MHKTALRTGMIHHFFGHTIGNKGFDPLFPNAVRFPHGYPDIGINDMCAFYSFNWVGVKLQNRTGLSGDFLAFLDQLCRREGFFRRADYKMHSHFCAADHQRVTHIISGVTAVDQFFSFQLSKMLLNGQKIRQDLRRMIFIGQTIPDRNTGVLRQFLYDLLTESTVLDPIEHTAQHTGGIRDRFFFADLRTGRTQISASHAKITGSHFKSAAGAGGVFFEYQSNIFAFEDLMRDAGFFLLFKLRCQFQQIADLFGGKIQQREKMFSF